VDDRPGQPALGPRSPAADPDVPGTESGEAGRAEVGRDNEPGLLDDIADRLGFRGFIRRHRSLELVYRAGVGVLGVAIMVAGFALIPLPGPGWLIVFAGLALLATEFAWAERLLHYGRAKFHAWTRWVLRQSLLVRGLITLLGLACVAGALGLYVRLYGVPDWIPGLG
jgi:uncharacterized protein (TIGR02611 family)